MQHGAVISYSRPLTPMDLRLPALAVGLVGPPESWDTLDPRLASVFVRCWLLRWKNPVSLSLMEARDAREALALALKAETGEGSCEVRLGEWSREMVWNGDGDNCARRAQN